MSSDLSAALDRVAQRFASRMPGRLEALAQAAGRDGPDGLAELRRLAHEIAGLAETLGFSGTGAAAAALERLAAGGGDPPTEARRAGVDGIAAAFLAEAPARDSIA